MPDPNERHAKTRDWGGLKQPPRGQQRASARNDDPSKRTVPSKKKKGECKGPDGWHEAHKFTVRRAVNPHSGREFDKPCGWEARGWWRREEGYRYGPNWCCYHEVACERCGHTETEYYSMGQRCPEFAGQPVPDEVMVLCDEKQDEYDGYRARLASKPPVTGPQSYRKKKQKKRKGDA